MEQRQLDFEQVKRVLRSNATSRQIAEALTGYFHKYASKPNLAKPQTFEERPLTEADIIRLLNSGPKVV